MSEINRRDFIIKGTAAGVGGFLALETLLSCRPSGSPISPDGGPDGGGFVPFADVHAEFPLEFTEKTVPTTCWIGKQDCGMLARVLTQTVGDQSLERIVKLEGNPIHPRNLGTLCPKGVGQLQAIYDYNRLKWPLRRVNGKGQPGSFVRISWAEALTELTGQIDDASENGKRILWQKGRSKAKDFYDDAFVKAIATYGEKGVDVSKIGHGSYCSDAGYRACEYTLGYHGVIGPDFAHTKYLLSWGWGLTTSGGNKFCWLTWPQKFLKARKNGLKKVVCLDPNRRQTGPHADEWLPNRPGSDLRFFLGMAAYLVKNDLFDRDYLVNHTNAPFLINADGTIKESDGKPQVWNTDGVGGEADFNAAGITPALTEAENGAAEKTAYQLYQEHLAQYDVNETDAICGLPALTTARIARELYDNANIGGTITLDGETLPYRPVSMMAYHVAQQELGFPSIRAALNVFQLLGAIDVPGGIQVDFGVKGLYKNWDILNNDKAGKEILPLKTNDIKFDLAGSKFFPISSSCPSFFHRAQLDPARYDVDPSTIPKKVIIHMVDPVVSFTDTPVVRQAYSQFEHVTVISPWLSETADHFADLILPAATLEKYEGVISCSTPDENAKALRLPPVAPLWESKGEIDIYLDIAERGAFLAKYVEVVNKELKLTGTPFEVPASPKPTPRQIFDAWAKSIGKTTGIDYFEQNGVTETSPRTADKKYSRAQDYFDARHRLYGEMLKVYGDAMQSAGINEDDFPHVKDYTEFPTWREPTMWGSVAQGYPLHLLSHKQVEFKQSRASFVPILAELSSRQGLMINPQTASGLGIADGDDVYVTSHNAMTGETRSVKTRALFYNSIRPDTVSMSHHYGLTTHPSTAGQGPTPNTLYFAGEGYIQCTQDASFHVMVKVTKA